MSCRGVLFAIDEKLVTQLKSMERDDLVDFIADNVEEEFFAEKPEYVAELDKSWDAIRRSFLADHDLTAKEGDYPLSHIIFGSEVLYGDNDGEDYVITLKTPQQVQDISKALEKLTKSSFKEKYYAIDETAYGFPLDDEDYEYTWNWLRDTMPFWRKASKNNLFVIFTVDL